MREILEPLLLAGEVATCGIVDLELLYSASGRATYRALSEALRGMPRAPLDEPRSGPASPSSTTTPTSSGSRS